MKKASKALVGLVLSMAILILWFPACAQDSTAVVAPVASGLPDWVVPAGGILLGIYELLVRYVPTVGNYSLLSGVIKIIQLIVPNRNSAVPKQPHP